jgi:hypothetical protein
MKLKQIILEKLILHAIKTDLSNSVISQVWGQK